MRKPFIVFVGPGRCGKDECCRILESVSVLKNAGTTSKYLTKYVAQEMGVDEETCYRERHQNRQRWREIGDQVRRDDPAKLVTEAMQHGDITGGIRGLSEIVAVRYLVDLVVWVDRDVPPDETLEFGKEHADLVLPNHWSLDDLEIRLMRLAWSLGVYRPE
jgi:hypothetical protein